MKAFTLIAIFSLFVTGFPLFTSAQVNWSPDHVYYGVGGKLTYIPDEQGNTIPDFSHVGYRYGDEPIPDIPVAAEVEPVEGDDGANIQAAINSLYSITPDENGFRGAVLLKKGTYQVAGQIRIAGSGIVLRGEGDTEDGTVIVAEGTSNRDLIRVDNGASRSVISSSRGTIIENYVPVGRNYVLVSNASVFTAGEPIVIYRPGTSRWISDLKMDQISTRSDGGTVTQWSPSSYSFYFERILTRVSGDTLFFRNPVIMAIETKYGGGAVYKYSFNRIQNVGIEDLCLKSAYVSDTDENHSWTGISIRSAEHGWVRNVTAWYFSNNCVILQYNAKFFTVANCHMREPKSTISGGRRYSFHIDGSLNLVTGCTSDEARHDYVTGSRVTGPNVFINSTATNTHADIGPHHRWAMGSLYDNIVSDGEINVQDRDHAGSGHGWAGANHVFWNCQGSSSICQNPWVSAKNYNFGFMGAKSPGFRPDRPDGEWVGHNVPGIFPVSLYEAQLNERRNDPIVFSLLPQLKQLDDTTFLLQFSLPLNSETVLKENLNISFSVEVKNFDFSILQTDEWSVQLSSKTFKELPVLTTIVVTAQNFNSLDGRPLYGITSVYYTTPDLRPRVTGVSKIVDNEDDHVEASTSKPGMIFFVSYGLKINTLSELDSLVNINQGRKVVAGVENLLVHIYTKGLPGGYYVYYAVDQEGRVSPSSTNYVIVQQTGPITGAFSMSSINPFTAWQRGGEIAIDPGDNLPYALEIYTINGKKIYQGKNLHGIRNFILGETKGLVLIRKCSIKGFESIKLVIN